MNKLTLTAAMSAALPLIGRLEQAGFETVFVGGAVRDALLGKKVKDVDIATAATPGEVMALFPRCIPTGLAHGTVTVMHEGVPYEVTTYRQESEYVDYRKPSAVTFVTDLDGDLLRRDFTVNAMALRADGSIHDPYGGLADLRQGLLRCVGDAEERFREDALRMVRAVRFIGTYGFRPALSAWRSLRRNRELLRHVAMERIHAELDKMIESGDPGRSLAWLHKSGLLLQTKEPLAFVDAMRQPSKANHELGFLSAIRETDVRWAALAITHEISSPVTRETLEALRMSNKRTQTIVPIVALSEQMADWLPTGGRDISGDIGLLDESFMRLLLRYGLPAAKDWLRIERLMASRDAARQRQTTAQAYLDRFEKLIEGAPLLALKELDVSGAELAEALGRPAGPWLKHCLDRLLLESALGRIDNKREVLVRQAAEWEDERAE